MTIPVGITGTLNRLSHHKISLAAAPYNQPDLRNVSLSLSLSLSLYCCLFSDNHIKKIKKFAEYLANSYWSLTMTKALNH